MASRHYQTRDERARDSLNGFLAQCVRQILKYGPYSRVKSRS
jgi:hypothetical protein